METMALRLWWSPSRSADEPGRDHSAAGSRAPGLTPVTEPAAAQAPLLCCEILGCSAASALEVTKIQSKIQVTDQTSNRLQDVGPWDKGSWLLLAVSTVSVSCRSNVQVDDK